ncbi:hypothetical protein C3747_11g539 [Trypanosoma cruzi]|uniref:RRM domain-containing protein n=2 Tax=Trypanosoma cruzi TaxID=5693 RepID=Q4D4H5_TRYCC|nr:hypothetical protein, conserved [Trypanosoma cruzi]EAN87426.1 hypothetical protein, conserved [Trypanosoma cruzi]KAF5222764.1 hypothetical protein ECC02_004095 [Trypanosoma cruzi]PWV19015.1 hypothetical protein C3747_11g539 [Trypanosoma cruzi]RNC57480.1 putative RNA-binding protein [Trypanosoma cruzi]|eukprot:XP_809277.1 hypothetical protein [Trypanosoma cruzi strain CL Brener]
MLIDNDIIMKTAQQQVGKLPSNMGTGNDKNEKSAAAKVDRPSRGSNLDEFNEKRFDDALGDVEEYEGFSAGGGLYMESGMEFVISIDDNDDDGPAVSQALNSAHDSSPSRRFAPNGSGLEGKSGAMNNWNANSQQQQQQQQRGIHPCDHPASTANGSINSDVFFVSYSSWTNHANTDSAYGEVSPAVSSTLEPLVACGGVSPQQPQQPFDVPIAGITPERDAGNSQSRRDPQDEIRSNLFVSGLHASVTDNELYKHFHPYGEIESAKVMLDIHTGKSRGIAFVKFKEVANAEKAAEEMNNSVFHGETIAVRVAKPHAAYRPGAPTNKTFVRNIPLNMKKAELIQHFGLYGEVVDVSIHNDAAQRSSNNKRNVAFVTYTTKEAAARAARETHTSIPFPECEGIPLLAKVAEDSAHRNERLARRGICRHGGVKNTLNSANNSVTSSLQGLPQVYTPGTGSRKTLDRTLSASAPSYPFVPSLGGQPVPSDPYASGNTAAPAFYAAPFFPVATGATGTAPLFLVGPESRPAVFAPSLTPLSFSGSVQTMAPMNTATTTMAATAPTPQLMMYPQATPPVVTPQSTIFCYLPNGQMTLAATPPQQGT